MIMHKGTQDIETKRLRLRKITVEDAPMAYRWMSDPQVCKYERWEPHGDVNYTRGYIHEVFGGYESDRTYQWGIQLDGELIGSVSIVNVNDYDQKAVLGYCLATDFWSNGYTTEAASAVIRYMLLEVGLNRIEASCSINNKASARVLEKVGMTYEGHAKAYYHCNAGFQDSNLYGITRADYINVNAGK